MSHILETLRCRDRWGREIVLTDDVWYGKILTKRPQFATALAGEVPMAVLTPHPVQPRQPDPATIDWQQAVFEYDRDSDIFALYFFGPQHPAKVLHTDWFADILVDPTTHVIVGYQIEGYLTRVVHEEPWLLRYAEVAGILADEVEAIGQRLARNDSGSSVAGFTAFAERAARRSA